MSGLILGGMFQGLGAGLGAAGAQMMRDQDREAERERDRQFRREMQSERLADSRARASESADAKRAAAGDGSGKSDYFDFSNENAIQQAAMEAGMTVPEFRQMIQYQKDGKAPTDEVVVDEVNNGEDMESDTKVTERPGFKDFIAKKRAEVADAIQRVKNPDKYKGLQEGRAEAFANTERANMVGGDTAAVDQGARRIAGMEGKELYGGDSTVTRDKFTGATKDTDMSKSERNRDDAAAAASRASAGKAGAETSRLRDGTDAASTRERREAAAGAKDALKIAQDELKSMFPKGVLGNAAAETSFMKTMPEDQRARVTELRADVTRLRQEATEASQARGGKKAEAKPASPADDTPPVSALAEGKVTKFKNGERWTLVNGKPKRV